MNPAALQKCAPVRCDPAGADHDGFRARNRGARRGYLVNYGHLVNNLAARHSADRATPSTDHSGLRRVPGVEARGKPRLEPKADGARLGTMATYGIVASARAIFMQAGSWPLTSGTMGIRANRSPQHRLALGPG